MQYQLQGHRVQEMPLSKTDVRQVKTVKAAAILAVGWGFNDYIKFERRLKTKFNFILK